MKIGNESEVSDKSENETKHVNIGELSKSAADEIDLAVRKIQLKLKEAGFEVIPKKHLLSAAIVTYLTPWIHLDWKESKEKVKNDYVDKLAEFLRKHGGADV